MKLASEFPAATREQWEALAAGVEPSTTYDGIVRSPLYTADDVTSPHGRLFRDAARWDVRAWHAVADAAAILDDLEHGVTSLWLAGPAVDTLSDVPNDVAVTLDAGAEFLAAASRFPRLRGNFGADPLGVLARTGIEVDLDGAVQLARIACELPETRSIVVDALPYHEAGGSDAQELGCAVATGVAYLRALTDAGCTVDAAAGQLDFRFAAGVDQFLTIAKFRAARRLWAWVIEASGGTATAQRQHAVTSPAMLTRRDPYVNMVRTTVSCFAAGVGGADAVTVLPFDSAIGQPEALGRRIARNTQSILLEESFVAGVLDPAGESWYVERLTEDLVAAAWSWFTEIERAGGLRAALDSGMVADRLARTWSARKANLESGVDKITGVTVFSNPDEQPLRRQPVPPPPSGGLPRVRYAEEFE